MAVNDVYFSDDTHDAFLKKINGVTDGATNTIQAWLLSNTSVAIGDQVSTLNTTNSTSSLDTSGITLSGFTTISAVTGPPAGRSITIPTGDFTVDNTTTAGTSAAMIALTNDTNGTTLVHYIQEVNATTAVSDTDVVTMPAITVSITDYDAA